MTNDIIRRVCEHKMKTLEGFTAKYNVTQLVWYQAGEDVAAAIAREKQIKRWRREKKIALIESLNPGWRDLSADLGIDEIMRSLRDEQNMMIP